MLILYLRSFVTKKYMFILPSIIIVSFGFVLAFYKTRMEILRTIALALVGLMLVVFFAYQIEKSLVTSKARKIAEFRQFDEAVIVDRLFVLELRMLVYHKGVHVLTYDQIQALKAQTPQAKQCVLQAGGLEIPLRMNKQEQEYLAGYFRSKQPTLVLEGIQPQEHVTFTQLKEVTR